MMVPAFDESANIQEGDQRPTKVRRIDDTIGEELTPDLWANVLEFLPFDEALTASILNSTFLNHVAPMIEHIFVRVPSNLNPASVLARNRFHGVRTIEVTCLVDGVDEDGFITRDKDVCEESSLGIPSFLGSFPMLERVFLGGVKGKHSYYKPCIDSFDDDEERRLEYQRVKALGGSMRLPVTFFMDTSNGQVADENLWFMKRMVQDICQSFVMGRIGGHVKIDGLFYGQSYGPPHAAKRCPFTPRSLYDSDSSSSVCRVCPLVCRSFPPKQVLELGCWFNNCVPVEEQVRIASQRDPSVLEKENLDKVLHTTVQMFNLVSFVSESGVKLEGIKYSVPAVQKIEWLIGKGADPRHPAIRQLLVNKPNVYPWESLKSYGFDEHGLHPRRVWSQTLRKFEEWNLDVEATDFHILSKS